MKLIVGLGNPGKKYENTRHNLGFMIVDKLANDLNVSFKSKFDGLIGETHIGGEKVLLLKPQTFMNLSGRSVKEVMNFYDLSNEDLIVIFDDLAMEFGKIKTKDDSSAGGHNGIKDIINQLGTQKFFRIKFGILNDFKKDTKDFVLSNFSKKELEEIDMKYNDIKDIIIQKIG